MNLFFLKNSIRILTLLIVINSCSKDDENESSLENETNGKTTAVFNPEVTYGTMTDQDGNIYKTVTIGTQTWMAENLRTTKYNDGTKIPNVTNSTEWDNLTTGAYCNYNNATNKIAIATYGRLYNWYAVNTGKLCPSGWRIPDNYDWKTLINYLGGNEIAGGKLKEMGEEHWISSTNEVTNISGFTALPAGVRHLQEFYGYDDECIWWSSTDDYLSGLAYYQNLFSWSNEVRQHYSAKVEGFSVRCVQ